MLLRYLLNEEVVQVTGRLCRSHTGLVTVTTCFTDTVRQEVAERK